MPNQKVVVTCLQMQESLAQVQSSLDLGSFDFVCPQLVGQQFSEAEMKELLQEADYAIVGDDFITDTAVANSLLMGVIKWGIGFDSIDTEALTKRGIRFSNTPGQFAADVAEQAIALLLAVERGLVPIDSSVRKGEWLKYRGRRISGRSALILGYGNLGLALAPRLTALGLKVSAFDPYAPSSNEVQDVILHNVFPQHERFDYLISCLPLTDETKGFVNRDTLAVLQSDGVFINVSRGKVVNQGDLVIALTQGLIGGAGLDVYETEPLPISSELGKLPNVVLGAHNSSNTDEGVFEASIAAAEILLSWAVGER